MTLRHITAEGGINKRAKGRERDRKRSSVRDKTWTRNRMKENPPDRGRERGREFGIISLMDFNSASFLVLLVIKSYRKKNWKVQTLKDQFPDFALKKCLKSFLSLKFCHVTQLQDPKFRQPVMIDKLRIGQKYSKVLKTIANFDRNLLKIVKLSLQNNFIVWKRYSVSLF